MRQQRVVRIGHSRRRERDGEVAGGTECPARLDLPGSRIIAYYGNPHSKKMGVLGEYPEEQMLSMLDKTVASGRPPIRRRP